MDETRLSSDDFTSFFRAIWGFDPFPWQQRLLHRLATGEDAECDYHGQPGHWPDVLDLPTGSGKTATLDIALFHLALDAAGDGPRRAPVRIAFVVDRRLIVDDAFARARCLCRALRWSLLSDKDANLVLRKAPEAAAALCRVRAEPVVARTALRLCRLAESGQPPMVVRRLRGGAPREDDWARTPVQPTILCSTVDQVGSRLLFRGYGLSDRMRPIHAGLLGSDCLILLDEAHLSKPFRQTLEAVNELRAPDTAPFEVALLTATPDQTVKQPFALWAADFVHPVLRLRISASKPARLQEITGKQGLATETRRVEEIAAAAGATLESLRKQGIDRPVIGVVVNRVARARAVFDRLRQGLANADAMLLIGPARSIDRDKFAEQHLAPIRTGRDEARAGLEKPRVVVATQTIEVGVDLDFDGLVTEAAAFDALRQRFGRVNRNGRPIKPEAVVLAHKDDIGAKADDAVYGDRIRTTWDMLQRLAADAGVVDFGIAALQGRIDPSEAAELAAQTKNAPVLMPAYADLWSQTWPIPNADPEVALFLHGPDRASASVQIVWRADIQQNDLREANRERLIQLFKLVPPRASEAVEVSLWAARAWLQYQDAAAIGDLSDTVEREPDLAEARGGSRPAFRWAGEDSERRTGIVRADRLQNGDSIVVPASYGGCDEWGWDPRSDDEVIDRGADAHWPYRRRRFAVRVTAELIAQGRRGETAPSEQSDSDEIAIDLDRIRSALAAKLAAHEGDRPDELLEALLDTAGELPLPPQMRDRLEALDHRNRRKGRLQIGFSYDFGGDDRPRGVVFLVPRGLGDADIEEEEPTGLPATESDDLGLVSDQPITLLQHSSDVRHWAEGFATAAGLEPKLAADVALAGYLHDAGKADPRFQAYLAGGDPYGPGADKVLAKSGKRYLARGAWQRAGLPDNWRHEALSVRLALVHPKFERAHDRQLVLWLIGSHHGYGRPLFPHADPEDAEVRPDLLQAYGNNKVLNSGHGPQSLAFDFCGLDWVQQFEELKRRYGIWGLARLESFLRLADHRASEDGASAVEETDRGMPA
jgi:CRISPR-associated endonuclease/helicase Cas3